MNTVFVKRIVFTAAILSAAYFSGCHKVEETAVTETLPTPTVMTTSEAVPAMAVITESEIETESETTTGTETEAAPRVIVPKLEWDSLDWNKEFMEDTLFVGDSVCRAAHN